MTDSHMGTTPNVAYDGSKPCEIVFLLDRSGSMESTRWPTIQGYNKFLNEQKAAPGIAYVSLFQFDDKYECVYAGKPLHSAPELNRDTMVPRGATALYDAVIRCGGEMLKNIGPAHNAVFVILTDGGENASHQKDGREVGKVLDRMRERGWQIMFIGANQDAIMSAQQMGLNAGFAMSAMNNAVGTASAYAAASSNTMAYRATGAAKRFTRLQRNAQVEAGLDAGLAHLDESDDQDDAALAQTLSGVGTASGRVSGQTSNTGGTPSTP